MLNTQINKNKINYIISFKSSTIVTPPCKENLVAWIHPLISKTFFYYYYSLKTKYKACQLTSLSLMLCRHCELLVLLALGECAQSFLQRGTGSSSVSDWVGETAACIHVPLFHEPWLTCWFYSREHDILQKQTETASCRLRLQLLLQQWHQLWI